MRLSILCCFVIVLWPAMVSAAVYRCVGEAGEPEFRQHPCGATALVSPAGAAPPKAAGVRPSERAWLKARERAGKPNRRSGKSDVKRVEVEKTGRQAHRCRSKQRALDAVNAELRRGYKPAKGDSLRRRQNAYRDYLDTFCS